jgi:hypothetical protein
MSLESLEKKIHQIEVTLKCHGDLLGILNAQEVANTGRLETILSVLREVLAKHGVEKEKSQKLCGEIFASCLSIAQTSNEHSLSSVGKSSAEASESSSGNAAHN